MTSLTPPLLYLQCLSKVSTLVKSNFSSYSLHIIYVFYKASHILKWVLWHIHSSDLQKNNFTSCTVYYLISVYFWEVICKESGKLTVYCFKGKHYQLVNMLLTLRRFCDFYRIFYNLNQAYHSIVPLVCPNIQYFLMQCCSSHLSLDMAVYNKCRRQSWGTA